MTFFPHLHEPGRSSVLDRSVEHPVFEAFYRTHIAKLLLARGADRYVSKANYNITRLAYLQRMFPEARFVLPIRKPESHIGSLMRQHKRFTEGLATNPKGREHLRRIGHFEFGPDRRPVCVGRSNTTAEIADLWSRGEEIAGWARYWAMVYGFVADQFDRDSQLRDAVLVLRYEDLCSDPARRARRTVRSREARRADLAGRGLPGPTLRTYLLRRSIERPAGANHMGRNLPDASQVRFYDGVIRARHGSLRRSRGGPRPPC